MGNGSVGVLDWELGLWEELIGSASHVEPVLHGFQIIRSSRTVGTDEGRDLQQEGRTDDED